MKTAIISSDSYEKHITGDGHPEQPKRVIAIKEKLKKRKDLIWEKPDKVPEEIFSMTHSKGSTNSAGGNFNVQSTNSSGNAFFTTVNKNIIDPLKWYHMAIIRESGEIKLYFDGVYYPFASAHSVNTTYTFDRLAVGVSYAQYAALTGHISNFRLVVGSGVYTPSSGGGGSTIFDGSGDNLLVPSSGSTSTDLVIGTNDIAI